MQNQTTELKIIVHSHKSKADFHNKKKYYWHIFRLCMTLLNQLGILKNNKIKPDDRFLFSGATDASHST